MILNKDKNGYRFHTFAFFQFNNTALFTFTNLTPEFQIYLGDV